jgi:hypothetical protein
MSVSNDQVTAVDLPGISKFTISGALANAIDEIIPGVDWQYIHYLRHNRSRGFPQRIGQCGIMFFSYDLRFDLSTPLTRAAALVLVSSMKDPIGMDSLSLPSRNGEHTERYYDAFCHYAKLAIESQNCLELTHATFYLAISLRGAAWGELEWLTSKHHIDSILVHILQFCRISDACSNADLPARLSKSQFKSVIRELRRVLAIFRNVCTMLFFDYPSKIADFGTVINAITRLSTAVLSRWVDVDDDIFGREGGAFSSLRDEELFVDVSFKRLLDRARYGRGIDKTPTSKIVSQINTCLGKTIDLLPGVDELLKQVYDIERHLHPNTYGPLEANGFLRFPHLRLPDGFDLRTMNLTARKYCHAQLMRNLVGPDGSKNETRWSNLMHALAICRLVHAYDLYISRKLGTAWIAWTGRLAHLFWAGLVMKKWNYDPGELRDNVG